MRNVTCRHALTAASALVHNVDLSINGSAIGSVAAATDTPPRRQIFALPALINAHDHARVVRTSSFGAFGKPLEMWLHYLGLIPAMDPYLASLFSLARSALGGTGTVMVHYTRVQGLTDLPTEAREVARAARDVGVRVGFAVAMRDRNPLVYGPSEPVLARLPDGVRSSVTNRMLRPPVSVKDQIQLVDAVVAAADSTYFNVQYGPAAVQWCTHPLLEAIAEASQRTGRRIHMHMLETKYQRAWADENYPNGMLRYLDRIGLLSPRLTLAHCTWARPDELELLAERGVTIAVNTSSNLALRSGIAPLGAMLKAGCRVALGMDGVGLDDDDDALREMRLAHLLHAGWGYDVAVSREQMLDIAFSNGHRAVLNHEAASGLVPGAPADLLLLDWTELDEDNLRDDLNPVDLLLARARAEHIHELIVGGRTIVKDGVLPGIDLAAIQRESMDQARAGIRKNGAIARELAMLDGAISAHFQGQCGCG